jgi:hypothetical protein
MQYGRLAAWPDPQDLPVQHVWTMTEAEAARTPLAQYRVEAIEACHRWRIAAEADGWTVAPTYGHEPIEQAWVATREGFKAMGIARPLGAFGSKLPVAKLDLWAPDGLIVLPMPVYDWDEIKRRAEQCMTCGSGPTRTFRVGFVERHCGICVDAARRSVERPGWCD